jgi:hypothetical protein
MPPMSMAETIAMHAYLARKAERELAARHHYMYR